jgi:hypothetical protein
MEEAKLRKKERKKERKQAPENILIDVIKRVT